MYSQILLILLLPCVISCSNIKENLKKQSLLYAIAVESEKNTSCNYNFNLFLEEVEKREIWALNMLDSSGQDGENYLFTNNIWLGSMNQCKNLFKTNNKFDTKFVTIAFKHNNTMQEQLNMLNNEFFQIGLCVPKSCTIEDISTIVQRVLNKKMLLFLQNYPVELKLLQIKNVAEEIQWIKHPISIFTIIYLVIILILTIIASYYDVYKDEYYLKHKDKTETEKEPSLWAQYLLCFSFPKNVRSLFNTDVKSGDSMPVLHGLKSFAMFYIIFAHFPLYLGIGSVNIRTIWRTIDIWYVQIYNKSALSVETCFYISGFIFSYGFYKSSYSKRSYSLLQSIQLFFQMVFHRVLRTIPSYIIVIGIVTTSYLYYNNMYPLYCPFDRADQICPTYWWRNLLFITTWYPRSEMCMTWTWYISNDMQFYFVTCALLILSTKYCNLFPFIFKLLIVYSVIYTGWLANKTKFIYTLDDLLKNEEMYYNFAARMTSYFVGILSGFYFNKWNGKIPLSNEGYRKGWIICTITFLYVIHGLPNPTHYSKYYVLFYVSFSKFLWSSCISWLVLACLSNQGGVINKFLSLKCWIPFSRVTFGVYFTHLIIINSFAFSGERSIHISVIDQVLMGFGALVISFTIGAIFAIIVENPIINGIKSYMRNKDKKNCRIYT